MQLIEIDNFKDAIKYLKELKWENIMKLFKN
jgi:hypothetical protein